MADVGVKIPDIHVQYIRHAGALNLVVTVTVARAPLIG